ncbi:MAG: hypothetical protein KC776_19375 [Myxococcales bacterium]|nr:hypothetical protein [Myxococcales bacterium]MCB9576161.1 hypothetical protein [Polyangiaceae bacterium]
MAALDWLPWRRPRRLPMARVSSGRVEIEGEVEALATLPDPVSGRVCVALEYEAAPPSALSVTGVPHSTRAYTITAHQAVDFVLTDGDCRVLVKVPREQDDVARVHAHLTAEHGLALRVAVATIEPGERVVVVGRVVDQDPKSTPYRSVHYRAIVHAERFFPA